MILHMLGGGPAQLSGIKKAKELGHIVVVSDSNPLAPGFEICDLKSLASTFDEEAVYRDAIKFKSDFIMTTGTDQPVLTAARVSERLGLPYFLTPDQALIVTNKKSMKNSFKESDIPTMPFVILNKEFLDDELKSLKFPLVIKPLDSQGQRGVIKVETIDEIRENFDILLGFSRETQILAEEYYPSTEITISGWVNNRSATILTITDRVTINNGPHIGVCISHRYPSLNYNSEKYLKELTQKITNMIGLQTGPLYFQILSGNNGFIVNEIACRLGGAYEDEFIPYMTGVPLMDIMVKMTAGTFYTPPIQTNIDKNIKKKYLSLQMFFTKSGLLKKMEGMDLVRSMDGVLNGRFLLKNNTMIESRENSSQRTGYFIITGNNIKEVNKCITEAYEKLIIENESGEPMLEYYKEMLFPNENN